MLHDVINDRFAHKAIEKGADGLIAVAAGAGGHAGTISPFALVAGDSRMVRRAARAVGRDRHRRRGARGAGDGRRFRLYRLGLHRHRRGARGRRLQAGDRRWPTRRTSSARICSPASSAITCGPRSSRPGSIPTTCPQGDVKTMNFDTGGGSKAKAWRDIWGSGQGIGAVKAVTPVAELVARLKREYDAAKARVA